MMFIISIFTNNIYFITIIYQKLLIDFTLWSRLFV